MIVIFCVCTEMNVRPPSVNAGLISELFLGKPQTNDFTQCIRCNKKIRIKIFVLWFHGCCHIEQIDVRLLSKTQNRNDVSTWNLVQMSRRHRYTTLFSWNFKFLFEIWITVKSNMIGWFVVTMATNSKHWRHDYVCYVTKYLCPKYDIDRLFNF